MKNIKFSKIIWLSVVYPIASIVSLLLLFYQVTLTARALRHRWSIKWFHHEPAAEPRGPRAAEVNKLVTPAQHFHYTTSDSRTMFLIHFEIESACNMDYYFSYRYIGIYTSATSRARFFPHLLEKKS